MIFLQIFLFHFFVVVLCVELNVLEKMKWFGKFMFSIHCRSKERYWMKASFHIRKEQKSKRNKIRIKIAKMTRSFHAAILVIHIVNSFKFGYFLERFSSPSFLYLKWMTNKYIWQMKKMMWKWLNVNGNGKRWKYCAINYND